MLQGVGIKEAKLRNFGKLDTVKLKLKRMVCNTW